MPIFWSRPTDHNGPPRWYHRHGGLLLAVIILVIEGIAAYQWTH